MALTKVVTRGLPLKITADELRKFVPLTVRVKAAPAAMADAGCNVVTAGTGFVPVTLNVRAFEVPPPGAGLVTVTLKSPAVLRALGRTTAMRKYALTNDVTWGWPPKLTTEPLTNPVPLTLRTSSPEPAAAVVGDIDRMAGSGLVTLKLSEFDEPPPGAGLVTTTASVPGAAASAARI